MKYMEFNIVYTWTHEIYQIQYCVRMNSWNISNKIYCLSMNLWNIWNTILCMHELMKYIKYNIVYTWTHEIYQIQYCVRMNSWNISNKIYCLSMNLWNIWNSILCMHELMKYIKYNIVYTWTHEIYQIQYCVRMNSWNIPNKIYCLSMNLWNIWNTILCMHELMNYIEYNIVYAWTHEIYQIQYCVRMNSWNI